MQLPLQELWRNDGTSTRSRGKSLSAEDIGKLLRLGPLEFVVADAGLPLRWIEVGDCHRFWKNEVKRHLAEPNQRVVLDEFPGSYCYVASQWNGPGQNATIVVLERHH